MKLDDLMAVFAAQVGLEKLESDADGVYSVSIDDLTVSFAELKDSKQLVTMADVGEPPPGGRERLYRVLMEAMCMGTAGAATGGAVFSVSPESEMICLHRVDALASLDFDGFTGMLEKFVNVLDEWRRIIADFRDVGPARDDETRRDEAETSMFGLNAGGFIWA